MDTNDEDESENDEQILISKQFHLVSLNQAYTQNLTKESGLHKFSFYSSLVMGTR